MNYHYDKLNFHVHDNDSFNYGDFDHQFQLYSLVSNENGLGKRYVRSMYAKGHIFFVNNQGTFASSYCNIYLIKFNEMEKYILHERITEIEKNNVIDAKIHYSAQDVFVIKPVKTNFCPEIEPGPGETTWYPVKNETFELEYTDLVELKQGEDISMVIEYGYHSITGSTPTHPIHILWDINFGGLVRTER